MLTACAVPRAAPPLEVPATGPRLDLAAYLSAAGPVQPDAVFDLPAAPWREARLTLRSLEQRAMPARIQCDGQAWLAVDGSSRSLGPGLTLRFTLPGRAAPQAALKLTPQVRSCRLDWGAGRHLAFRRTEATAPRLARLDARREACRAAPAGSADPLVRAFYANGPLGQTCARPSGRVDLAADAIDALAVRLEALTGARPSRAALLAGDPDMPLDFTRAPRLDLVVVSYLHIRADLSGHLVRRALEYHAARGTRVRILTSGALMLDKDRRYWESLAARYPNVQMEYFRWKPEGPPAPDQVVDTYQRSNHTKYFLTLSPQPGRSRFIIGGRNLHDGFFFDKAYDLSTHPELRSYDRGGIEGLAWHTVYLDFEVVMHDDAQIAAIASHFARLWARDESGTKVAAPTRAGAGGPVPVDGVARHFMSVPWSDSQALEAYYVRLIDAARREILIATPFLYPPAAINAALDRAHARGVKVTIVTRLSSTDPPGFFTTALNHAWVNARMDRFAMWNYEPDGHLIHTKLLLIDGRLGVVGSVNLNARSFLHDTENGVVFLDRGMTARLSGFIQTYMDAGERLDRPLQNPAYMRLILAFKAVWQYF